MAKKKTNTKVNIENTPTECNAVTSEVIKTEGLAGSLNVGSIRTPEDITGSTIVVKFGDTLPSTFNKVTFENMSMDLLLKYKEAIVSLIKDNQHLAEINKGFDYWIYNDATSKINKLNRYLNNINSVIEKNIFDIEIE